jgi:hypothetical protein
MTPIVRTTEQVGQVSDISLLQSLSVDWNIQRDKTSRASPRLKESKASRLLEEKPFSLFGKGRLPAW